MHSVIQLKVTDRKFGGVDVIVQGIEFGLVETAVHSNFGVEPLECIEILSLKCVIKRLTEIEIFQVLAGDWRRGKSHGQGKSNEPSSRSHRFTIPPSQLQCCRSAVQRLSVRPSSVSLPCGR